MPPAGRQVQRPLLWGLYAMGRVTARGHVHIADSAFRSYIDTDETYRRDIRGIRNLQESRHRPGEEDLPRPEGRAVPPVRARPGESARRPRTGPELRRYVDDGDSFAAGCGSVLVNTGRHGAAGAPVRQATGSREE